MKTVLVFCLIVLASGCTRNTVLTGTYSALSNPDFLQINEDSTFYFKYSAYHMSEFSSGRWQMSGAKKIKLNSEVQESYLPIIIHSITNSKDGILELRMKFELEMASENYKYAIFINDTLYQPTQNNFLASTGKGITDFDKGSNLNDLYYGYSRCDSLLSLKIPFNAKSIFFKVVKVPLVITSTNLIKYSLETQKYTLAKYEPNQIEIVISFKDFLFNYRMFKNEELKIKKNGISIFNPNTNKWWYIPKASLIIK